MLPTAREYGAIVMALAALALLGLAGQRERFAPRTSAPQPVEANLLA
ncbi:MAG TPA: hypothetical protein VIJ28_09790 [Chloroflexota bacterium]